MRTGGVSCLEKVIHLPKDNHYAIGHDVDYYFRRCHDHIGYYEILFIIRGRAINVINGDVQILKTQSVTFIRPDDQHYINPFSNGKDKFEFFNIKVPVEIMDKEFKVCSIIKERIIEGKTPFSTMIGRTEFGVMCARLLRYDSPGKYEDTNISEETKYLYYSVVRDFLTIAMCAGETSPQKMPQWFEKLLRDLKLQNVAALDYSEMVEMANVDKSYLWKVFKKYLNVSPTEYINILRLERACELITDNKMSLTEIAYEVGYNNYSYFVRQFKKKYNCSPASMVRDNKNNDKK